MKIQNMFQKDIDRDINGVVKVAQDDSQSLKQELSEYIITKELRGHFATFFKDCACLFNKRNTDITSNIEKA